ncbi:RNA polymerase sigma factor [Nonlabens arenilitoris]|uniref:RNA polymerase sigma factor n=1 Tax=Nonlabens arenilitoris TaxID=1217969 RepID=UPI0026C3F3C9
MIIDKEYEILELINAPQTIEAGYRMLLKEYQQQLYWQIRKLVIDHDDAHDVLQNVFVKVFKGIKILKVIVNYHHGCIVSLIMKA